MTEVLIVQSLAKQYRVPFFGGLHAALARDGVRLRVAYGDPPPQERSKGDNVELDPAYGVHVPGRWWYGDRLHYQPVLPLARSADLVIVEQANKNLINLLLILRARLGGSRVAYWGQGRNVLTLEPSLSERLKARTLGLVDWWFAYTRGVAAYLTSQGVHPDVVTVVQNAIDTRELRHQLDSVTTAERTALRDRLGIAAAAPVGLFCGSLYAGKRVDFLLAAARLVRAELPGFHLLVVGSGPAERELAASADASYVHFLGRQTGRAKVTALRTADVFLMPAWVGLSVLDAFAASLPVLTTDLPGGHSVEVEYIEHDHNGLVTPPDPASYAAATVEVLRDAALRARLAEGARAAGDRYCMETMVENFRRGIHRCLDSAARRRERAAP
jgi:glycosyltransferase involved in cell wall biosynthesis